MRRNDLKHSPASVNESGVKGWSRAFGMLRRSGAQSGDIRACEQSWSFACDIQGVFDGFKSRNERSVVVRVIS